MNFRLFSGADVTIVVFRECNPLNKFTLLKMCPKYLGCFYITQFHPKNPQKISPPSETPDWFHAFGFLLPLLLDQLHEIWRHRTRGLVQVIGPERADSVVSPNQTGIPIPLFCVLAKRSEFSTFTTATTTTTTTKKKKMS